MCSDRVPAKGLHGGLRPALKARTLLAMHWWTGQQAHRDKFCSLSKAVDVFEHRELVLHPSLDDVSMPRVHITVGLFSINLVLQGCACHCSGEHWLPK